MTARIKLSAMVGRVTRGGINTTGELAMWAELIVTAVSRLNASNFGCPWQIRKLRRDWHLEQAAAMAPPGVASKDSTGGRRLARLFSWSAAAERLVNAILVVIIS